MNGLEHGWVLAGRIQIAGGRNANGTSQSGCKIGEDVGVLVLLVVYIDHVIVPRLTRLVATMVSRDLGSKTIRQVIASTNILSHLTSGKSLDTSSAISSHMTIPFLCAFDFVTTVRNFLSLFCASSKANRIKRSTACLVKMETSVAVSHGWPL